MIKVIAVLENNQYALTAAETAEKNGWYIAYGVEVVKEEKERPDWRDQDKLPKVGTVMAGIGGHVYRISKIEPTHVCAECRRNESANRVGKHWYCNTHYHKLVVTQPIRSTGDIPGRNEPCHCGSGRKYKQCCLNKDHHEPRHYFNSKYKQMEFSKNKSA